MGKPDVTELEELENGITSGFWERFQKHIESEWGVAGETYQSALRGAVSGTVGTEAEAVHRLKNIMFAQNAIQKLIRWPQERVNALRRARDTRGAIGEQHPSRRGPGL